jgi:arylsulfatase A-like enzyme
MAVAGAPQQAARPNNVLLIVIDDVGVDLLGCYDNYYRSRGMPRGQPASTPAIDQLLAARGVMFANAWTSPMCTPSRAQILTGRFAHRNGQGMIQNHYGHQGYFHPGLASDAKILPSALHRAFPRYECVALGKWHLADQAQAATYLHPLGIPKGNWFDRFAGSMFNLRPVTGVAYGGAYTGWRKVYATEIEAGVHPCPNGALPCEVEMIAPPVDNYATVDTADDVLATIARAPEPWFVYAAFHSAHEPTHAVPAGTPALPCGAYVPPPPCSAPSSDVPGRTRCMLEALDTQIGRILCSVDESDTTVILIGDNGTLGDAVLPPHDPEHAKASMYQGGITVPMIVRSPWVAPSLVGSVNEALVCSTDIYRTVAEIAGAPTAATPASDSVSLLPYLTGAAQGSLRSFALAESFFPNFVPEPATGAPPASYVGQYHYQAIRDARFKLIRLTERDRFEPDHVVVVEKFFDLLGGGPPDDSTDPPQATPDWFEENDLLQSSLLLSQGTAGNDLRRLRRMLDRDYPALVR